MSANDLKADSSALLGDQEQHFQLELQMHSHAVPLSPRELSVAEPGYKEQAWAVSSPSGHHLEQALLCQATSGVWLKPNCSLG